MKSPFCGDCLFGYALLLIIVVLSAEFGQSVPLVRYARSLVIRFFGSIFDVEVHTSRRDRSPVSYSSVSRVQSLCIVGDR